jgi:hypothetical protein
MENSKNYLPKYQEKWMPSNNLQYPEGVLIYYHPFSFGDLFKLNQSNIDDVELYKFILEGVEVIGMNKYDLTFYDVLYLGWRRKTASLGASLVDVKAFCPNCDTKNTKNIALDKLDFEDVIVKALPMKMKIAGEELKIKFVTIGDYIDLLSKDQAEDIFCVYAKSVTNKSFEEAYQIFYNATGDDLERISILDNLLYHGLKEIVMTCSNEECKHEYEIKLNNSQEVEIIKPFRGQEAIIRDEISFGE